MLGRVGDDGEKEVAERERQSIARVAPSRRRGIRRRKRRRRRRRRRRTAD